MFEPERLQLHADFGLTAELVRRYMPPQVREEALTMARQVNGVTTYLSWMATGEPRIFEGAVYAVGIAGMDVVTDIYKDPVGDGTTREALNGNPAYDVLEPLSLASDVARGPGFDDAVETLAEWQDRSFEQFGNPSRSRIESITRGKGGYSARAHLQAVKEDPRPDEREFMMAFGETMQLLDDYLDQPGDRAEDIDTVFTRGYADGDDLLEFIREVEDRVEELWGDTPAVRRFGRVMRLHRRLGQLENRVPGTAERLLPWYF